MKLKILDIAPYPDFSIKNSLSYIIDKNNYEKLIIFQR